MATKGISPRKSDDADPLVPVLRVRSLSGKHIVEAKGPLAIHALVIRDVVRWVGLVGVSYAGAAPVIHEIVSRLPW